jgi:uncharacterized protein (DUF433 family)
VLPEATERQPTVVRTERGLTIAGSRLTLYDVTDYVVAGWPPAQIRDVLHLTDEQMRDVIVYIAAHRAEVELEYEAVLRRAEQGQRAPQGAYAWHAASRRSSGRRPCQHGR